MFEQSVLDNIRQRRSKWSWLGLGVQLGVVGALLVVPMVSPEVLSVMIPKALIYVPVKSVAPVEVEVQPAAGARHASANAVTVARPPARPFPAPRSYTNPVNTIIDSADFAPPAFTLGSPSVQAHSVGPLVRGDGMGPASRPFAPPPPPPAKPEPPQRIRVGGNVQAANILSRTPPSYPPLAKQARVSGVVRLEGIIARDGTVQRLQVLSGHPLLVPAAVEAVKQWRYRPTLLNGEPVEVVAPIEVNFILSN
jgi:protein TonB